MRSPLIPMLLITALRWPTALAETVVQSEVNAWDENFRFTSIPQPANNDAATRATFTILDGVRDRAGAGAEVLHDGLVPSEADQPKKNFFFQAGSGGGRLQIDLGRQVSIREVNTYSWHSGSRGPQIYTLFASDGQTEKFSSTPACGSDLAAGGWVRLAHVDTRASGADAGGQYGASVRSSAKTLGQFRFLLFDFEPAERLDAFGNTFYSEIDVIDAQGDAPSCDASLNVKHARLTFDSEDGGYHFAIDLTQAPDLREWSEGKLRRTVAEWYPKLVKLLASEGYRPPEKVLFRFRENMGGTPASAAGNCVSMNTVWFRRELQREACGAVVHELTHVVQNYGLANTRSGKPLQPPGWVVEGIADYVRWFLFEPQSRGAEITKGNVARASYDASYRVSANFLDWASRTYDSELVKKLNASARTGCYDDILWQTWTGRNVRELGEDWLAEQRKRLEKSCN